MSAAYTGLCGQRGVALILNESQHPLTRMGVCGGLFQGLQEEQPGLFTQGAEAAFRQGPGPSSGSPFAASTLLSCLFTQGAEAAFRQGPGPSSGPPLQPAPCFRAAGPSCCLLARGCSSAAPRSNLELVWAPAALGPTRRRDCFRELLLALHGVRLGLFYTLHLSTPRRSAPTVPYLATPAQSSSLTPQRSFN